MIRDSVSSRWLAGRRYGNRLLVLAFLMHGSAMAHAQSSNCSDFTSATLDGFTTPNPPSQITFEIASP